MIEIVPIQKRAPGQNDTDKIFYIEDRPGLDGIAKKYNWAIENIALKSDDEIICFRHDDLYFRTPRDAAEGIVAKAWMNGCGVAGVIGTIALEKSCTWWEPNRFLNGSGYIIQGGKKPLQDKNGKPILKDGKPVFQKIEFPMEEHRGTHDYLATVDGCIMWINKKLLQEGLRFDENLKGYHFYDVDICLQALQRGYKVTTVPVVVKHDSEGIPPKNFNDYRKVCFEKWNARIDAWPISRLTKFHEPEAKDVSGK